MTDNWPFPVVNGQRTQQSLELMQAKPVQPLKDDLSDFEEATF